MCLSCYRIHLEGAMNAAQQIISLKSTHQKRVQGRVLQPSFGLSL